MPAKAVDQAPNASTDSPPSRASPHPQGDPGMTRGLGCTQIKCGSWLACESDRSGTECINCQPAFASKPAPTGGSVCLGLPGVSRSNVGAGLPAKAVDQAPNASTDSPPSRASPLPQGDPDMTWGLGCMTIKCGSWLACESGGSGTHCINCQAAIAGKPAPTGGSGYDSGLPGVRRSKVGDGLPAKAVDQAPNASTDRPPSRASPLPQGDPGITLGLGCKQIKCGSWLACESGRSGTHCVN